MTRHDGLAELQTQENLLMWILAECDPVDVKITLYQIRRVRRQMTAMRRELVMGKVRMLVMLVVMVLLSGFVVSAQGDIGVAQVLPGAGDFETLAIALLFGALVIVSVVGVVNVWITTRSMERVTGKVNESLSKIADFVQSDRVVSRLESAYEGLSPTARRLPDMALGLLDLMSDLSTTDKDAFVKRWTAEIRDGTARTGEGEQVQAQRIPFKGVRRSPAPPDLIDPSFGMSPDLPLDSWVEDEEVKG